MTQGETCLALVTVLFNCEKHLPLFFECLGRQTDRDFVVIVVDNASRDGSLTLARELAQLHGVSCEFIPNTDNLGVAVGNNQGVGRARSLGLQHVVLINNDIGCEDDLIAGIRQRAIGRAHRVWTCLAFYGNTERRWYGGGRLSWWLARGIHYKQAHSEQINYPVQVTYSPTCLMYVHMGVFNEVGDMDPRYFVYYDDTDFCRRIVDAGIPIVYDPTLWFRHYVGGSSGGDLSPFSIEINTRNKFLYIAKHYRAPARWIVTALAIASKLIQLASKQRRHSILRGLKGTFRF